MKKFVVIGGQYRQVVYGDADTVIGAKRIASKHWEYWDNWAGWHKPSVYASADLDENGYKKPDTLPVASWDIRNARWINWGDPRENPVF